MGLCIVKDLRSVCREAWSAVTVWWHWKWSTVWLIPNNSAFARQSKESNVIFGKLNFSSSFSVSACLSLSKESKPCNVKFVLLCFFTQIPSLIAILREADKPVAGCQLNFTTHPHSFPDNSYGRDPGNRNSPWLQNFSGAVWQVSPRELGFKGRGSRTGSCFEPTFSALCAQTRSVSSWWCLRCLLSMYVSPMPFQIAFLKTCLGW